MSLDREPLGLSLVRGHGAGASIHLVRCDWSLCSGNAELFAFDLILISSFSSPVRLAFPFYKHGN